MACRSRKRDNSFSGFDAFPIAMNDAEYLASASLGFGVTGAGGRRSQRKGGGYPTAHRMDGVLGDSESDYAEEAVSGGPEISGLYSTVPAALRQHITPAVSQQGEGACGAVDADAGIDGGSVVPLAAAYLDLMPNNYAAGDEGEEDSGNTSDSSAVTDLRVDDDVSHVATALLKMKQLEGRRISSLASQSAAAAAALMWASNNNDPQLLAAAAAEAAMGIWPDGGFGFSLGADGGLHQSVSGGAFGHWGDEDGGEDDEEEYIARRRSKVRV